MKTRPKENCRRPSSAFRTALEADAGSTKAWCCRCTTPICGWSQPTARRPAEDVLSPEELEIFSQWQAAELAAVTAALGPNRYMGDAQFEIRP
jgi:hypothetical protein